MAKFERIKQVEKVTADKMDADVTIKVMNSGKEVAQGSVKVSKAGKFVKLSFNKDGSEYRLRSGDVLEISGLLTEGTKAYTTNPYQVKIK